MFQSYILFSRYYFFLYRERDLFPFFFKINFPIFVSVSSCMFSAFSSTLHTIPTHSLPWIVSCPIKPTILMSIGHQTVLLRLVSYGDRVHWFHVLFWLDRRRNKRKCFNSLLGSKPKTLSCLLKCQRDSLHSRTFRLGSFQWKTNRKSICWWKSEQNGNV